jgi:aspartate-semialdehyde dehydrogenase
MNLESLVVALIGADDIQARELADRLAEMGLPSSSILTFGTSLGALEVTLEQEGADVLLPLEKEFLAGATIWVVLTREAQARAKLAGWAADLDATIIDLAPDASESVKCFDPLGALGPGAEAVRRWIMPEPAALFLARVLTAVDSKALKSVDCHLFNPASSAGERGIHELYQQSLQLLNFKSIPTEVWGRQLAFNLLPLPDLLASELFGAQARVLSGRSVDINCLAFQIPVFHGTTLSAILRVHDAGKVVGALRSGMEAGGTFKLWEEGPWPSPLETASLDVPILGIKRLSEDVVWLWLLYDNVKAGKGAMAGRTIKALASVMS